MSLANFVKKGVHAVVRKISNHATKKAGCFYVYVAETGEDRFDLIDRRLSFRIFYNRSKRFISLNINGVTYRDNELRIDPDIGIACNFFAALH